MKIAFLIQAHKLPEQLKLLVDALQESFIDCYISIDAKSDIAPFIEFLGNYEHVTFINKRTNVCWGEFSQVEATLEGLAEIVKSKKVYNYIFFISGQDYPIKPLNKLHDYLNENKGNQFLRHHKISNEGWFKALSRYQRYHLPFELQKKLGNFIMKRIVNPIIFHLPKRKFPLAMIPFGGGSWWCITYDCAAYILNFCTNYPQYLKFHRYTKCPDEMFFHSIIMNSQFAQNVINDNLIYVNFSEGKANPKTLTLSDFKSFINSNKYFARKFDINLDSSVLKEIANYIK